MSGRIIIGDATKVKLLKNSIDLVVTSPPYNVGMEYRDHDDAMKLPEWQHIVEVSLQNAWDAMVPGGRMCVNIISEAGRSPAIPLGWHVQTMMEQLPGSLNRGTIVWNKGASTGGSTAWGSWMSPANPTLRGIYENIYVYSKGTLAGRYLSDGVYESDISRDEFMAATLDVWSDIGTVSNDIKRGDGEYLGHHPAPFPTRLAQRLIQLYSYPGMMVLDPFLGSGTTGLAASQLNRDWIGIEISRSYAEMAQERIPLFPGLNVPTMEVWDGSV